MSLAWATITLWVMCPLMSSPRMSWARALASSGLSASLTPPALPRPPTLTWALTTTGAEISRAIDSASSGVSATPPGSTGTPCEANRSRAWYSKRSTKRHRSPPVSGPRLRALYGRGPGGAHHNVRHSIGPLTLPEPACPTGLDDEEFPVRRAAIVLLSAALTSGALAALAPPASATDIVPRDLTITVTDLGPEHRTCRIDADLYVPAGVNKRNRAAALLATNGFGGDKKDQADLAQGFGEQGYVTLSYTGIGFIDGDNCPITLDDREHDGAAASQLLRFLGGDPSIAAVDDATGAAVHVDQVVREDATSGTQYDPEVGMIGGS